MSEPSDGEDIFLIMLRLGLVLGIYFNNNNNNKLLSVTQGSREIG